MELDKPKFFISQNEVADIFAITPQAISIAAKQKNIEIFKDGNKSVFKPSDTRKLFESRGFKYPTKTIALQMLKGGSTKTSSGFNLGVRLNQYGARVLFFDLDPQGNLTDSCGVDISEQPVFYHVVNGECQSIEETIINVNDGLDLIPSDFENSTLDILIAKYGKDLRNFISTHVESLKHKYDFIIIDCNPSLSPLNVSIAIASDLVLIPVNPDKFSKKGLKKTITEIERISKEYKIEIDYNLLFTLYDGREALSHKFLMEYGTEYGDKLLPTVIKRSADVKTATDQKKSIFDFKKASAREDFDLLAQEILGIRDLNKKEIRA